MIDGLPIQILAIRNIEECGTGKIYTGERRRNGSNFLVSPGSTRILNLVDYIGTVCAVWPTDPVLYIVISFFMKSQYGSHSYILYLCSTKSSVALKKSSMNFCSRVAALFQFLHGVLSMLSTRA